MKKQLLQFFIIAAAFILVLAGCANPLLPVVNDSANSSGTTLKGALSVTIKDEGASRTILPTTPEFTKYRLEFSGPVTTAPVEDTTTDFDSIYLEPGEWTVTAYGYAMFESSEQVVAEGSGIVTVSAGSTDSLALTISAQQTGGTPGTFGYTLSVPEALNGLVDTYEVKYHPWGDTSSPTIDTAAVSYSGSGFSYSNSANIEPGYYLATIKISSSDYTATKMEIIHIYSNMVSSGSFDFEATDIVPVANLSGSLEILKMGVAQDESGWTVEAYTNADYSADSIIGSATTDASSDWSMVVEAQSPAADIYFRAIGTDDNSTDWDRPAAASAAVSLETDDISGISLYEDLGQITVSGTLAYSADGVSGSDLENWEIIPYFDNGYYYDLKYDDSCTTDSAGNWSLTIDESEINSSEPLGFQISKWNAGVNFYNGSAISAQYFDITNNFNLELITLSGNLTHTIDGISEADYSDYNVEVCSEDSESYSYYGRNSVEMSGTWTMLVPSSPDSREMYFSVRSNSNYEKNFHTSHGTISNSARTGLSLDLGESVTVSGTVDVELNETPQNLTTWNWPRLEFYTTSDFDQDSEIGRTSIEAVTGNTESWSLILPAQNPSAEIYAAFSAWDSSMEQYSGLDAGSFTLGTSPLTNQALTVATQMVTVSGTLTGTMNGEALTFAENEWMVQFNPQNGSEINNTNVNNDGTWSCSFPESATPVEYYYYIWSNDQGYHNMESAGTVSVYDTDIPGISIELDLVQISGPLEVTLNGTAQDLSNWDYYSIVLLDSPTQESSTKAFYATVTPGNPATWIASIPVQSPEIDLYAFFSGTDGSSNEYFQLEAGTISSVGSNGITGQALSIDSNMINVSGTLQLEVDGSASSPIENDWNLLFFEDTSMSTEVANCTVAWDGSWSIEIEDFSSETDLFYLISSSSYAYSALPDATRAITVHDSDLANQTITVELIKLSGTLTAGTDPAEFSSHTSWSCTAVDTESQLLLFAMNNGTLPIADENWSVYVTKTESGTTDWTIGFLGTTAAKPYGILYQTTVTAGASAVSGIAVEYSALEVWGCKAEGTLSAGSSGADFNDDHVMYLLNSSTLSNLNIIGYSVIAADGTFSAQLNEESSPYDVWIYVQGTGGAWFSDSPISLGGGDVSGLSISLNDMTPQM